MARSDDQSTPRACAPRAAGRDAAADARPRRAAVGRRRDDPAASRRLARQMAPGAHHLVLRNLHPARSCAGLPASRRALALPVQQLLRRRRRAPRPARGAACSAGPASTRSAHWRAAVDEALQQALPGLPPAALELVELGINHEQQHQELFLTDILATFAENPLEPAYAELRRARLLCDRAADASIAGRDGMVEIGAREEGFAFDCERPRHRVFLHPHRIASRSVTNGEWQQFIADGGYTNPTLWLSEGWDWVQARRSQRAALLERGRQRISPSPAAARSTAPRRSRTSAFTRPMPSPAGPARGCRPRPNGKASPFAPTRCLGNQLDHASAVAAQARRRHLRRRLAMDRPAPISLTPASLPRRARSANTMASS